MTTYTVISLQDILTYCNIETINSAFSEFKCEREKDLETFLVNRAIRYEQKGFGRTYLCLDNKAKEQGKLSIIAYFTISFTAMRIDGLSSSKKKKVLGDYPGRDTITFAPSFLIGQLGRSDSYSQKYISGHDLLKECYHMLSLAYGVIGGQMVILECREHMFSKFYENYGFKKLHDDLNEDGLYTLYQKINFDEYITYNE